MQNNQILENQKEILSRLTGIGTLQTIDPNYDEFIAQFDDYFPLPSREKALEIENMLLLDNSFKNNMVILLK